MPKLGNRTPGYCKHRASGQAVVTLDGKDFYLGPFGTKASKVEYDRLIGEWLANGRRLKSNATDTTVLELAAAYWTFAEGYYRKNGKPTRILERVKIALRPVKHLYGPTLAADFGPLALQAIQARFVQDGKARP